ncbi:MAG: hypothetical protein DCF22_06015 [Leptolyngbya sp.]|nr:MAG: hypothetical protein DCF22_06015 [Leptolyngbya sp.]
MWFYNAEQDLVYTGGLISPEDSKIPDKPSPQHVWDGSEWQYQLKPNWAGLMDSLRGSAVYAKIWTAAREPEASTVAALKKTVKANTALTLLQDSFKSESMDDLQFAIATLREDLSAIASVGDFTSKELIWINSLLETHQFPFRLS